MPFIPVPEAWEVVVRNTLGSIDVVNVFGYHSTDTLDQAAADAVGTVLNNAWEDLLGFLSTGFTMGTVTVTDLSEVTGAQFVATTYGGDDGTDATGALPFQVAALISWRTNTRGRSFRGRTYMGGFCEDFSTGRDVSPDLVTALNGFAGAILADGGFSVISRFSGVDPDTHQPIPRDEGLVTEFTDFTTHPLWRTQRGRATR